MKKVDVPIFLLTAFGFWLTAYGLRPATAQAQSSNGTYTLMQDLVSSAGGQIGGGNPMQAQTVLGLPAGGAASNASFQLIGGIGSVGPSSTPPITMMITVTGTIDDAAATVTVNGIPATITGTTFSASGVQLIAGPNTITATATDPYGNSVSRSVGVYLDLPPEKKTPRFSIQVTGSIDEPTAGVTVNGVSAAISSGQFTAMVPLVSGLNTLTATAVDPGGNQSASSIRVFVPPPARPPAKPTVGTVGDPPPAVTIANSLIFGGTKTPGTSIWINGQQLVALGDATTWSVSLNLVEGDNAFTITAKDATGASSAEVRINVIRDELPPVVTFAPPAKTNFNPATLTGSVDDSKTVVAINGVVATRSGRNFSVSVPLSLGPNTLQLTATSPNNHLTTQSKSITLGTIPTIQSATLQDGAKAYATQAVSVTISASDQEGDPIQYQVLLDGTPLGNWTPSTTHTWTPALTELGIRRLTLRARDDYGGSRDQGIELFVVRPPIQPP